MKIQKEISETQKEFHEKIKAVLTNENLISVVLTVLGAADNICDHIFRTEASSEFKNLNFKTRYGILMVAQMLKLFRGIRSGDFNKNEDVEICGHFPVGNGAWKSEEDFEKRLITFIKFIYEDFQKEGKI